MTKSKNLIFWAWPKFRTPTNINLMLKKYAGESAWTGPPAQNSQAHTGWDTCPALLRSSTRKKISGTKIRRTPDVKLRFVGYIRFVGFNVGQAHLLRFVDVMVWSNSFVQLDSVKWIILVGSDKIYFTWVLCFINFFRFLTCFVTFLLCIYCWQITKLYMT